MSLSQKLLSAEESAERAGVSVETILMFERCGLLEPVITDGRTLYKELDIRTVFYSRLKQQEQAAAKPPVEESTAAVPPATPAQEALQQRGQLSEQLAAAVSTYTDAFATPRAESLAALSGVEAAELAPPAPKPEVVVKPEEKVAEESFAFGPDSAAVDTRDSDPHLPSSNQLIEVNKGLREQIQVLRDERDWLRSRVENLENRSEREQMLLLSESETIRRLVTTERKRGFWQRALPWFGKD